MTYHKEPDIEAFAENYRGQTARFSFYILTLCVCVLRLFITKESISVATGQDVKVKNTPTETKEGQSRFWIGNKSNKIHRKTPRTLR